MEADRLREELVVADQRWTQLALAKTTGDPSETTNVTSTSSAEQRVALEAAEARTERLARELDASRRSGETLEQRLAALESELARTCAALEIENLRVRDLEQERASAGDAIEYRRALESAQAAEEQLAVTEKRLSAVQEEADGLHAELVDLKAAMGQGAHGSQAEVTHLRHALRDLAQRNEGSLSLARYADQISSMRQEHNLIRSQLERSERDRERMLHANFALERQVAMRQREVDSYRQRLTKMQARARLAEDTLSTVRAGYVDRSRVERMAHAAAEHRRKVVWQSDLLDNLRQDLVEWVGRVVEATQNRESTVWAASLTRASDSEARREAARVREALSRERVDKSRLERDKMVTQQKAEFMSRVNAELENRLQRLETEGLEEIEGAERSRADAVMELDRLQERLDRALEEREELRTAVVKLEGQVEDGQLDGMVLRRVRGAVRDRETTGGAGLGTRDVGQPGLTAVERDAMLDQVERHKLARLELEETKHRMELLQNQLADKERERLAAETGRQRVLAMLADVQSGVGPGSMGVGNPVTLPYPTQFVKDHPPGEPFTPGGPRTPNVMRNSGFGSPLPSTLAGLTPAMRAAQPQLGLEIAAAEIDRLQNTVDALRDQITQLEEGKATLARNHTAELRKARAETDDAVTAQRSAQAQVQALEIHVAALRRQVAEASTAGLAAGMTTASQPLPGPTTSGSGPHTPRGGYTPRGPSPAPTKAGGGPGGGSARKGGSGPSSTGTGMGSGGEPRDVPGLREAMAHLKEEHQSTVARLQQRISNLERENEERALEVGDARRDRDAARADPRFRREAAELRKQLHERDAINSKLKRAVRELESRLSDLRSEHADRLHGLVQARASDEDAIRAAVEERTRSMADRAGALERELKVHKTRVARLEKDLGTAEEAVRVLSAAASTRGAGAGTGETTPSTTSAAAAALEVERRRANLAEEEVGRVKVLVAKLERQLAAASGDGDGDAGGSTTAAATGTATVFDQSTDLELESEIDALQTSMGAGRRGGGGGGGGGKNTNRVRKSGGLTAAGPVTGANVSHSHVTNNVDIVAREVAEKRAELLDRRCQGLRARVKDLEMALGRLEARRASEMTKPDPATSHAPGTGTGAPEASASTNSPTAAAAKLAQWEEGKKLQRRLEVTKGRLDQMTAKAGKAEQELGKVQDHARRLEDQVATLQTENASLLTKARAASGAARTERELKEAQARIASMRSEADHLRADVTRLTREVGSSVPADKHKGALEKIRQLKQQVVVLTEAGEAAGNVRSELARAAQAGEAARKEVEDFKRQVEASRLRTAELESALASARADVQALSSGAGTGTGTGTGTTAMESLEATVRRLETENRDLKESLATFDDAFWDQLEKLKYEHAAYRRLCAQHGLSIE